MSRTLPALCFACTIPAVPAQVLPGDADYDAEVPTLREVVGHDFGERITSPAEMERYLAALAAASPRVRALRYGETWEGRTLWMLAVGSSSTMGRLEDVRAGVRRLADPRGRGVLDLGTGVPLID